MRVDDRILASQRSSTSFGVAGQPIGVLLVLLGLFVIGVGLAACGSAISVKPVTTEDIPVLHNAGNFPDQGYRLEPGDTLFIRYPYHPEMEQEVTVEPDGTIMATRVGSVKVAGLRTSELEQLLKERTSDRLRNPEVVVSIRRYGEKQVYVGGEVGKPGPVIYRKGLTALQAVIGAGGFKDTARVDSVILVRAAGPDASYIARKLNLQRPLTKGDNELLFVAPHDIIFVPKTPIANADLWVSQHITQLFPFLRMGLPLGF
jgi:protein involved in polysaccharide export with SLBB domain